MKLGIAEILEKADKVMTKDEKVEILQKNASGVLIDVLKLFYDEPRWEWGLESKKADYKPSPYPDSHAALFQNLKKIPKYFLLDVAPHLTQEKKESMYVQFLEGLDAADAQLIEGIRVRKFPYKTINKNVVKAAFPGYLIEVDKKADAK